MIVLDTDVVSEATRPTPNEDALRCLNAQPVEALYVASVALAELLFGIGALPAGSRKSRLANAPDRLLALSPGRVLAFD